MDIVLLFVAAILLWFGIDALLLSRHSSPLTRLEKDEMMFGKVHRRPIPDDLRAFAESRYPFATSASMQIFGWLFIVLGLGLGGTALVRMADAAAVAERAVLPVASQVTSISVQVSNQPARKINDRAAIEGSLKLISENNRGWETSPFTFPTSGGAAVFETDGQAPRLVLWIGDGWTGARVKVDGTLQNHIWRTPPEVQLELRRLLGVDA